MLNGLRRFIRWLGSHFGGPPTLDDYRRQLRQPRPWEDATDVGWRWPTVSETDAAVRVSVEEGQVVVTSRDQDGKILSRLLMDVEVARWFSTMLARAADDLERKEEGR